MAIRNSRSVGVGGWRVVGVSLLLALFCANAMLLAKATPTPKKRQAGAKTAAAKSSASDANDPELVYVPANLALPRPRPPAPPQQQTREIDDATDRAIAAHPLIKNLLGKNAIPEVTRLDQLLDLNDKKGLLNTKTLQQFERLLKVKADDDLLRALETVLTDKGSQRVLRDLQQAGQHYRQLVRIAESNKDTAKVGRYSFLLGLAQEQYANGLVNTEKKKAAKKQSVQAYKTALKSLKKAPDEAATGITADDALLKIYSLSQDFGGIVPLIAPPGQQVRMTDDVGFRMHPIKKRRILHKGIDLADPRCLGWTVEALGAGRVVHSGWENGYGYSVIIAHESEGRKVFTRYAHLKKADRVPQGTVVAKGMPIGHCNNTGGSTGSHLHFELRANDAYGPVLDPKTFVATATLAMPKNTK